MWTSLCVNAYRFLREKTKLSNLRKKYGVPNGGYNLSQIQTILDEYNITSKAVRINAESVKALPMPFIAFWNSKHFIIVERVCSKYIQIVDPALGKMKISEEEFKEKFSKVAMYVTMIVGENLRYLNLIIQSLKVLIEIKVTYLKLYLYLWLCNA